MRTTKDRIRHTLLFEGVAIVIATTVATLILNKPVEMVGALTIALSLLAMGCNYFYNLQFDRWLVKKSGPQALLNRSLKLRIGHAMGFEGCLLVVSLPLIAWWLDLTLWHALVMDIGFTLFFMVYALVFNWAYDLIFPVPVVAETA